MSKRSIPIQKLAVTTLCGFLGVGKTTLLKHILETKHKGENGFRCAVIVNDMAALNIDASLVDKSAVLQSDEVISMQNGCICCTLKDDLTSQIIELAAKQSFDYMVIEASGVSEPKEIASLFGECDENHDHGEHQDILTLSNYAYLDTCVTVVDSNSFLENFDEVGRNERMQSVAQLLVEQIEFANVVIANKADLVTQSGMEEVKSRISILNPRAKLLEASNSRVDLDDILHTKMFDAVAMGIPPVTVEAPVEEAKSCCLERDKLGEERCCKPDTSRVLKSRLSEVILPAKDADKTKHGKRFGISSFVYRARRPFHPERLEELFLKEYFIFSTGEELAGEDHVHGGDAGEDPEELRIQYESLLIKYKKMETKYRDLKLKKLKSNTAGSSDGTDADADAMEEDSDEEGALEVAVKDKSEVNEEDMEQLKVQAAEKQAERYEKFNKLLRSKGFLWLADLHDSAIEMSQAGNIITLQEYGPWSVLTPGAWSADNIEVQNKTWQAPYGDRRQELVFIGVDLDCINVQDVLDECLLTDEEFQLGVDFWRATMADA